MVFKMFGEFHDDEGEKEEEEEEGGGDDSSSGCRRDVMVYQVDGFSRELVSGTDI
jgi:hypothetical protein